MNNDISRRKYVQLAGTMVGAAALAGCSGGDDDTSDDGSSALEIQHWWTAGGDAEAMGALMDGFREEYPDIEIEENPVAGDAGQNLQAVIRERVMNENPPSTWQDWPGRNLADYVEAGVLKDIGDIWEGDFEENFREGPKLSAQAGDPDNPYVAVPLNIHRINNLFYDVALVEEAGVDPTSVGDPEELLEAFEQIEDATDAAGLSIQQSSAWSMLQLWGVNLIGMFGPDTYEAFRNGEDIADEAQQTLEITAEMMDYLTGDAASIDNDEAGNKLVQDEAAFAQEGDWLGGNYQAVDDYGFEEDWDHVPWPGTEGAYQINTDSFPYPEPNPSPEATDAWMQWMGSKEGQETFNPLKGSVPCRTDVDISEFPPFLQRQFDDFESADAEPLTLAHGDGVTPEQDVALKDAMARFIEIEDVDETTDALLDAMSE